MMVMQKTLVHIDLLIALSRRTLTIAAELVEITMPLLAYLRFLAEGTRAVSRPYPTETHPFQMALDGPFMHLQPEGLFEECWDMLGMTDRSFPTCLKHQ